MPATLHPTKDCRVAKRKIYAKARIKAKTKHLQRNTFIQSIFVSKVATVGWVKTRREKSLTTWSQWGFWSKPLALVGFLQFICFYKVNSFLGMIWSMISAQKHVH